MFKSKRAKSVFVMLLAVFLLMGATQPVLAAADFQTTSTVSPGDSPLLVRKDGSLWMWNGSGEDSSIPVQIMTDVMSVAERTIGSYFAIKKDGSLWAWGSNERGKLGDGSETDQVSPVKVLDNVAQVSSYSACTMAVKTDGSLWIWGTGHEVFYTESGPTTRNVYFPDTVSVECNLVPILAMQDVVTVYITSGIVSVIKTDGTLWRWGQTQTVSGGSDKDVVMETISTTPRKVADNVAAYAGQVFLYAANGKNMAGSDLGELILKTDHTLLLQKYIVGGDAIQVIRDVTDVKAANGNALILRDDGSVLGFGNNLSGVCATGEKLWEGHDEYGATKGYNPEVSYLEPTKILDGVQHIFIGTGMAAAIRTDGSLWGWGYSAGHFFKSYSSERTFRVPIKLTDDVLSPITIPASTSSALVAKPTASTVFVNGQPVVFDAYNISGNNFFKLRDLAYVLSSSEKL